MKRFKYIYAYILAALFLLLGIGIQSYVSYSRARFRLQEKMDLEMQIAQEKLMFELYDAFDALSELKDEAKSNLTHPDNLYFTTKELIRHYRNFYSCYVAFPPYYYPQKGKWFGLISYRSKDTIISGPFGSEEHDYFQREWYKGAIQESDGYWSTPYKDPNFDEPIYTYSDDLRDKKGNLICVIGIDFSLEWIHKLLDQFKPFEEAVFILYSSNGTILAASDGAPAEGFSKGSWIISSKTLQPINIQMVTAIPQSHILKSLRLGTLLPLSVFLLGLLVVGLLVHRLAQDERKNSRLETEKKVLSHELQIAHGIQMGILKDDNEAKKAQGDGDLELHTLLVPMREVGGDFFDYYRKGDELWFIIGDVSGKGVPAALIMSAAVNLFRAAGVRADSPKEIMEELNAVLSENNPSLTFVTAFIGCLRIPTGELLFCNAGHCAPIIKSGQTASEIAIEPNIPLGYDGRYVFVQQGCMIAEDQTLVLYTDGVTEARNSEREMLGRKRWTDIVAQTEDHFKAIKRFMGQAEPTDDITIMTIRKTSPVQPVTLCVPCHDAQWPVLRKAILSFGICIGMDKKPLKQFVVAAEEAVVNILHYSHATQIEMSLLFESPTPQRFQLSMTLQDDGVPFDTTVHISNANATDERQVGGMGIHLISQIVDEIYYERKEDKNILRMVKSFN